MECDSYNLKYRDYRISCGICHCSDDHVDNPCNHWQRLTVLTKGGVMGYTQRGKRDGTGPYKASARRKVEGKKVGRRKASGVKCPKK